MIASIKSLALLGIDGILVTAETDMSQALPSFDIVGLPDLAVKESKERVRSAIKNCGFSFPIKKITVNLAPGNIKKEGPIYDLPILIGILSLSGGMEPDRLNNSAFIGEVSLDGNLRRIDGALPMTITAQKIGIREIYLPFDNAQEAAVVSGISVYGVKNITELYKHLTGQNKMEPIAPIPFELEDISSVLGDFSDVRGQENVKRGLEIAAAGFHNLLMIGPPGSGKSMLAKRLSTILPPLTFEEAIESTKIYSVSGLLNSSTPMIKRRPFRAPHHTISSIGLSGGGRIPRPGEVSLSHNGVLFLDELPEFQKDALEILRQPLEDSCVTITRVGGTFTYPSSFMLVCAMNPCKCGYLGHPTRQCTCSEASVASYLAKISGPLLDRIDIHIDVAPVEYEALRSDKKEESSKAILARVNNARQIQSQRYKDYGVFFNGKLSSAHIKEFCRLGSKENEVLKNAFERLSLSARAYDKILRVSRTIADLEGTNDVSVDHILEAISYRSLDRKYFNR